MRKNGCRTTFGDMSNTTNEGSVDDIYKGFFEIFSQDLYMLECAVFDMPDLYS